MRNQTWGHTSSSRVQWVAKMEWKCAFLHDTSSSKQRVSYMICNYHIYCRHCFIQPFPSCSCWLLSWYYAEICLKFLKFTFSAVLVIHLSFVRKIWIVSWVHSQVIIKIDSHFTQHVHLFYNQARNEISIVIRKMFSITKEKIIKNLHFYCKPNNLLF